MEQPAADQELINLIGSFLDPETQVLSESESEAKAQEIFDRYRECRKSNPKVVDVYGILEERIMECAESICSQIEGKPHQHYSKVVATLPANPEAGNPAVTSCQEQLKEQRDRCVKGLEKYGPGAKSFVSRARHFLVGRPRMDYLDEEFIYLMSNVVLTVVASINNNIRGTSSLG